MTKKDYVLIAAALRESRRACDSVQSELIWLFALDHAAAKIANKLEHDNPRFDRDRFLVASGVEPL